MPCNKIEVSKIDGFVNASYESKSILTREYAEGTGIPRDLIATCCPIAADRTYCAIEILSTAVDRPTGGISPGFLATS